MGRRRLGPTWPSDDVTVGSGTNQTSGSLSSLPCQTKKVELECGNLGFCCKLTALPGLRFYCGNSQPYTLGCRIFADSNSVVVPLAQFGLQCTFNNMWSYNSASVSYCLQPLLLRHAAYQHWKTGNMNQGSTEHWGMELGLDCLLVEMLLKFRL